MMHADGSISWSDFCKLVITTPQYAEQYPNIVKVTFIALFIPATSVECKWGFSLHNCINTKFRSLLQNLKVA